MGFATITAILTLACNALMTNAQAYTCDCDGLNQPKWDDCATIASTLDGNRTTYPAGSDQLPCVFLNPPSDTDPNSLDCTITYCKRDGVAKGEPIAWHDILLWYTSVTANCKSSPAGELGGGCGPGPAEPVTRERRVTVHAQAKPYYPDGQHGAVQSTTRVWATPPKEEQLVGKREHARDFS